MPKDWKRYLRVKVSFQDAQGNSEGPLASVSVGPIVKPNNTAATGKPGITGTARVGQTLTATVGTIADVDGLPAPFFSDASTTVQWIRVEGGTETDITDAVASTYTLVDADAGKKIKVKVGFSDTYANDEGPLTSDAYPSSGTVLAAPNTAATGGPFMTGTQQVGHTLTATVGTIADVNGLPNPFLTDANTSFQWVSIYVGTETDITGATGMTYTLMREDWGRHLRLKVSFQDAQGNSEGPLAGASVGPILKPNNTAATGKPGITGTARVGQTLTATVGTIADVDELRSPFISNAATTVQWIRVEGGTETDITDAVASTYTLVDADAGKKIKVKVGFRDTYANDEGPLTSDAYPSSGTVLAAPNTAPTSADNSVGTREDTDYVFFINDFPFMDQDADDNSYISVKIETLPAPGKGTLALAGTVILSANLPKTVPRADINTGRLKYSPPENENAGGLGFTSFTFKVNDGEEDSSLAYTMTLEITNVNDPATGKPGITGTAQVGQTLTATVGTIADVDGLPAPFFSHASTTVQWVRVDGGVDTDIESATAGTYTLATADEGKKIKVKVSFRDRQADRTTSEGPLTSDAYPPSGTVLAAPNTAATGGPFMTGTRQVGHTLTATVGTIADVNGLPNPFLTDANTSFQWVSIYVGTETDITGATGMTYTLMREDWGRDLRLKVSFQDAQGNSEGPLAGASAGPILKPNNTAATGKPGITGTARVGQTLTATVGTIADVDELRSPFISNASTTVQWIRVEGGTETDITDAVASTYTLVDADAGKKIKVKVGFSDTYANDEGPLTSDAYPSSGTVLAAPNTAATGGPFMTGTRQVGHTLTATVGTIADVNGLPNPFLTDANTSFQWVSTETDITGATGMTYTLMREDWGRHLRLKVSFQDAQGNSEGPLAGASVGPILKPNNTAATGKPGSRARRGWARR